MNNIVAITLAVLYVLSPIDFVPEALLGPFGLIDDALAVYAAIQAARG